MKTVTAADANRGFSNLLKQVRKGEEIIVLSRGTPVAKITSVDSDFKRKNEMKRLLLERLKSQSATGARNWTRDELYED
jgi:prevent-host-death family protein